MKISKICNRNNMRCFNQNYINKNFKSAFNCSSYEKLKLSPIRAIDIGNNYFSNINPKRKKILLTLLNSYIKSNNSDSELQKAFDIFYRGNYEEKIIEKVEEREIDISESICKHIYNFFVFERISTTYSRFDYMDYQSIIDFYRTFKDK